MEVNVCVPNFLRFNAANQIVWCGLENVPIGTILSPFQSSRIQKITFETKADLPQFLKEV